MLGSTAGMGHEGLSLRCKTCVWQELVDMRCAWHQCTSTRPSYLIFLLWVFGLWAGGALSPCLLQSRLAGLPAGVQRPQVQAIYEHLPGGGIVEALQQSYQG